MAQADSTELKNFGLTAGLTSYPAAYATGLLLARRVLKQLKLADLYKGKTETNGEDYDVSTNISDEKKPFKVLLDLGLRRPTVGARVFGVMKGACDGGLNVPHNNRRFPGFVKGATKKKSVYKADVHRERIFGVHIDNYMALLKEESQDRYMKQFSKWDACLTKSGVDSVEALMGKVFEQVR